MEDQEPVLFELKIDKNTLTLIPPGILDYPHWTELEYEKCSCCALPNDLPHCPAAVNLIPLVEQFSHVKSIDNCKVTCTFDRKQISKDTNMAESLMYLVLLSTAASNCPFMSMFKPYLINLSIFASFEGAIFNLASLWLLGQYFSMKQGDSLEINFHQIDACIEGGTVILKCLIDRLRATKPRDGSLNAFIKLSSNIQVLSIEVAAQLARLDPYFKAWSERNHLILINETKKMKNT